MSLIPNREILLLPSTLATEKYRIKLSYNNPNGELLVTAQPGYKLLGLVVGGQLVAADADGIVQLSLNPITVADQTDGTSPGSSSSSSGPSPPSGGSSDPDNSSGSRKRQRTGGNGDRNQTLRRSLGAQAPTASAPLQQLAIVSFSLLLGIAIAFTLPRITVVGAVFSVIGAIVSASVLLSSIVSTDSLREGMSNLHADTTSSPMSTTSLPVSEISEPSDFTDSSVEAEDVDEEEGDHEEEDDVSLGTALPANDVVADLALPLAGGASSQEGAQLDHGSVEVQEVSAASTPQLAEPEDAERQVVPAASAYQASNEPSNERPHEPQNEQPTDMPPTDDPPAYNDVVPKLSSSAEETQISVASVLLTIDNMRARALEAVNEVATRMIADQKDDDVQGARGRNDVEAAAVRDALAVRVEAEAKRSTSAIMDEEGAARLVELAHRFSEIAESTVAMARDIATAVSRQIEAVLVHFDMQRKTHEEQWRRVMPWHHVSVVWAGDSYNEQEILPGWKVQIGGPKHMWTHKWTRETCKVVKVVRANGDIVSEHVEMESVKHREETVEGPSEAVGWRGAPPKPAWLVAAAQKPDERVRRS